MFSTHDRHRIRLIATSLLFASLFEFECSRVTNGADEAALAGDVTDAEGQPVPKATVVVVRPGTQLRINDGKIARNFGPSANRNLTTATTDPAGHFKLSDVQPPYVIVVLHDKGYAEILSDQITDNFPIQLQPWARIEGQLFIGDKPAVNETVMLQQLPLFKRDSEKVKLPVVRVDDPTALVQLIDPQRIPPDPADQAAKFADFLTAQQEVQTILGKLRISSLSVELSSKKTDATGHFLFQHIVPGRCYISRGIAINAGKTITTAPSHELQLDLALGETAQVVLGGTGRPVIGRLEVPLVGGKPFDWSAQQRVIISVPPNQRPVQNAQPGFSSQFDGSTDGAGNFRVDNVLPGDYRLYLVLRPPDRLVANNITSSEPVGELTFDFTVPELPAGTQYSPDPVDLGTLKPKMLGGALIGDKAPDFKLKALDGSEIALADLRGKIVVLNFWSAWDKRTESRLPALEELYAALKDNPRFVMLGISVDKLPKPAADFVAEKKFAWPQIQLPDGGDNPLCKLYGIRDIPAFIVIGPDGTIVDRSDFPQSLRKGIDEALARLPEGQ